MAAALSAGWVRLAIGYGRASQGASRAYEQALEYEKMGASLSERDAVFLLGSYHVARTSMPVVPEWWWTRQEARLNTLWQEEVSEKASDTAS